MKQIIQSLKDGKTKLVDLPMPSLKPGHVLIHTTQTLVSLGTEKMLVKFGQSSMIEKIKKRPDQVKKALQRMKSDGIFSTINLVKEKLLQELEINKKDIHRLKKKKEAGLKQLKFIKLFMDEEKKRSDVKLKQQEEYLQLENEKKIQQLQKIHQQMTQMMQNQHEKELNQSSKLFDKETKKKLDKYKKEIEHYRNFSSLIDNPTKSEDLYDYPPIHKTHKPRKKKQTAKKVKKDRIRKGKAKKVKRSFTRSLRKLVGI